MPEYKYSGVDRAGKRVSGELEAPSEGELRMILRSQGVRPTRISAAQKKQEKGNFKKRGGSVPIEILVGFTRQLQLLISSGIPLVQSLDVLQEQAQNANMKGVIMDLKDRVSQGAYLWESLALYPKVFSKLYVALIRAGEASGALDSMLKRLTHYVEETDRLRKLIKSAMMYPVIVVIIGAVVIGAMLIFVIPKFEEILKSGGQELPGPTQFVIDLSHFLVNNILYICVALGVASYFTINYLKSPQGKAFLDHLLFRMPIFGQMMQKAAVARFSRTMQTLLASGINMIDAVEVCRTTIDNAVLEKAVERIRTEIESGKTLGTVLTKLPEFPKMAVQMITVGESTGGLDKMLDKVADFYEAEVEMLVAGLTKMIEPLVLAVLGGVVGGLMIAMYLPIFKMAGGVN